MNIKFKKTLTLSLLASMVITPTVALAMNFNNESVSNVENNDLNAREASNNDVIKVLPNFETDIEKEIKVLNDKYALAKKENKYFSDVFTFDLGLKFSLTTQPWVLGNSISDGGFEPNSVLSFYNEIGTNTSDKIMLDNEKFRKGTNSGWDDKLKDPNLALSFTNTIDHKQTSNHVPNQLGSVKTWISTYNSKFKLEGEIKRIMSSNRIIYASTAKFLNGEDHYLNTGENSNIFNGLFLHNGSNINPQTINRYVDVFSQEDSLKIFNMIFDNNYLPEAVNADGIKTHKDLTNEFGKMIKFSDDFKVLKSIGDLSNNIELLNSNLKKHGTNGNLKPHLDKANIIIENLNKGLFGGRTIAEITADLISINNIITADGQFDLKPLISFIKNFNTNNTLLNKEFGDLSTNLILHGLLLNNENNTINNINFLYERLIGWLSVNNISFNINGVDHIVFEKGVVNNLKDTLDIFKDPSNTTITKNFVISEVKINRRLNGTKYDKNIFSENVILNDIENKDWAREFLTDSNYKIAYSKDYIEAKIDTKDRKLARSIPISILDKNLLEYLENINGDVDFTDKVLWDKVKKHIDDNIFKLKNEDITNEVLSKKYFDFNTLVNILNWDNVELLKFLDFEGTIDETAKLLLKEKLTNQYFNDEDGIFYSIATIHNWNGDEAIVGNEKYIGHYKEQEQKALIDSINKDGAINIIEIEPSAANSTPETGYFILKLRTMKNSYTENAIKYEWLMKNFNYVFEPIIDVEKQTEAFGETIINKVLGYKMNWDYIKQNTIPKKAINVRDELFLKVEKLATNSSSELFNYRDIIFNDKNINYEAEINTKLNEINDLVKQNKNKIMEIDKTIFTPNVLNIMSLIISLFVGIIIVSIIIIKILQDKKIDKKLNSKGINKKRYVKN